MSITFSSGCGSNNSYKIASPIAGWDTCYLSFVITDMGCIITADKVAARCHCDASGNCAVGDATSTLLCDGQPIVPFPHSGDPNAMVSGSCTYKKSGSTSTPASVTITSGGTTSAGISLTKSNMLITASFVLCAVIGSF
ncbi:hypothetical protein INT44_006591 [Umbelopsis vinacea]|uniref:Uncharacterized protein n=1 Tax=Umbelopsis vinacea TaxID=44442 RepID=A0A8H7PTV7_9FUNG|nr:hypothetical protein INT44_006591 [Umbelopsis vinacea]